MARPNDLLLEPSLVDFWIYRADGRWMDAEDTTAFDYPPQFMYDVMKAMSTIRKYRNKGGQPWVKSPEKYRVVSKMDVNKDEVNKEDVSNKDTDKKATEA
jgi:hypothetical protein